MSNDLPIILGSSSPARAKLLAQIGIVPAQILAADLDETPHKNELPHLLAQRLSRQKGDAIAKLVQNGFIISADTVAVVRRTILPKALSDEEVRYCLRLLSGRRHRIFTGITITKMVDGKVVRQSTKLVTTILKFKRLDEKEISFYVSLQQGLNKAGGYSVQGYAESFIELIRGSFSNIVGLPLTETKNMLLSLGAEIYYTKP